MSFDAIGCLIAELVDYRPARAKDPLLETPDVQRVVLRPNSETVWADVCMLNLKTGGKMSDKDALQLEAKILVCLSYFVTSWKLSALDIVPA